MAISSKKSAIDFLINTKGFSVDDAEEIYNMTLSSLDKELNSINACLKENKQLETAEHLHKVSAVYRVYGLDEWYKITEKFEIKAFKEKQFDETLFNQLFNNLIELKRKLTS